jgi:O-acetyl-ADP-ribose deacetylase (regulator of RNase III)
VVHIIKGDLFNSTAQTLVNAVNCVGIMGKGLALEYRKRFPDMYDDYVPRCAAKQVRLGEPYVYQSRTLPWILNFPTKKHWRAPSRLEDIISGLDHLETHYEEWGITSLAVPALGCGEGLLDWTIVGPILLQRLSRLEIPVELYEPLSMIHHEDRHSFVRDGATSYNDLIDAKPGHKRDSIRQVYPSHVALVLAVDKIRQSPDHSPVGRTLFQMIAYFATVLGLPTGLRYVNGKYGPFAPELKQITTKLINNGLIYEDRVGRMIEIRVGPTYPQALKVYSTPLVSWDPTIERIVDLALRLDITSAKTAVLAHYAAQNLANKLHIAPTESEVLASVTEQQRGRLTLTEESVAKTIRTLSSLGWLDVKSGADNHTVAGIKTVQL